MKPIFRRLTRVLLALFLLLVLVVAGVLIYLNTIAKIAVERGGTAALGVSTTVQSVSLNLLLGECVIHDLKVANPSGYDTANFLTLKSGKLDVAPATLLQDKIVVPDLELTGVDIDLEDKDGKQNYQVIMDNLHSTGGGSQPAPSQSSSGGGPSGASGGGGGRKTFVISKVVIKDVTVHAGLLPFGGNVTRMKVEIPEIDLPQGVGSDTPNGVLLSQVSGTIAQAILKAVSDKAGSLLPGDMGKSLSQGVQGLGAIGATGVTVANQAKQMGKELGKDLKDVGQNLKNIFGGDQNKDQDQSTGN